MSDDQPRPVWLTREQRDWLERLKFAMYHEDVANAHRSTIIDAWDAAPADATEAVNQALSATKWAMRAQPIVDAVLRALGMPDA